MDDVKVHYNSERPAQLNAHAYAQGTDIHLASGQEKHLPHEAWHVVQQKQGRVKPTMQMKQTVNVNDDEKLEKEADVMGAKALQFKSISIYKQNYKKTPSTTSNTYQLSLGSWISKSLVSLGHLVVGTIFRVPKRTLNLVKHLSYDLIRSIYHACRTPQTRGGSGLMAEQNPIKTWGAGLLTKILDIGQVRELMGFFTTVLGFPLSQVRGLSDEEKALAKEIFGDSMNLADVTILEKSAIARPFAGPGGAFTAAHTIHADAPLTDTANPAHHAERQAILMHELMHIAQEQKEGIMTWIELQWGRIKTRNAPTPSLYNQINNSEYNYGTINAASRFRDFSREQQGAIVQDYAEYLKITTAPARHLAHMINGRYGSGTYGHYQTMLQGLQKGHWAIPFQHPDWKDTIG